MKKILLFFLLIIGIFFLGNKIFDVSFAYSYDIDRAVLFYKDNYDELEEDVKTYLSNIDDIIISNSSYLYSDKLSNNYDFLVHFANNYINNNKEYYYNDIMLFNECSYVNKYGVNNSSNEYINLELLYEVTDFYFGIKDFTIINDDVCIENNYVSLSIYNNNLFLSNIVDVIIRKNIDGIDAIVDYDDGSSYLYSFVIVDNVLKINNVEVIVWKRIFVI